MGRATTQATGPVSVRGLATAVRFDQSYKENVPCSDLISSSSPSA